MNAHQLIRALALAAGRFESAGTGDTQPEDLVGSWCQARSTSGLARGGSFRGARFTLFRDGRYRFEMERSVSAYSSHAVLLSSSDGSDSGRWSVAGPVLTAVSDSLGLRRFALSRRNCAAGEPMLCLDGECFVGEQVRAPW